MSRPALLFDQLSRRVAETPDSIVFTFVGARGQDEASLTYRELQTAAGSIAGYLTESCGVRAGDRVLMAYTPSLDFVVALIGCMMARVVPVPVCPPNPFDARFDYELGRFDAIAKGAGASAVLTNGELSRVKTMTQIRDVFRRGWRKWSELDWYATDSVRPGAYAAPTVPAAKPDDLAFLQYTSGSTAAPKGVMITYGNLAHQLSTNAEALGFDANSRIVMWVPHYHDFGLISGILSAASGNGRLYMMSPLTFIQRPELWIDVLSRVRGTHTAAPDFAYDLVVRKTAQSRRDRWDLGALRVAMSAAEPVRQETIRAFNTAFASAGFRPESFCPAYGLAEHTVGVSVGGRATVRVNRRALEHEGEVRVLGEDSVLQTVVLTGCGEPARGVRVRIVDPETRKLSGDGRVGEIWVDSPSKAAGYFGLEDASRETFRARLDDASDATEYLRTGDLGMVHGGEVYVTGRLKDLIIIRGRNVYPQDVEDSVRESHAQIRPGGIVAFAAESPEQGEQLIVVAEVRARKLEPVLADEIASAIRRTISHDHQIACHTVVLATAGAVLKTTSGKVMRAACKRGWLANEFPGAAALLHRSQLAAETPRKPVAAVTDPRLDGLDASMLRVLSETCRAFGQPGRTRRAFHPTATTLRGVLEIIAAPGIPRHATFTSGARFPVLVRHANGVQDDDAVCDNRGATVRVLHPGDGRAIEVPLLDLPLTTGQCFVARSAQDFLEWMSMRTPEREDVARRQPHIGTAAWTMYRSAQPYTRFHYYSKTANRFLAADGTRWFARFRLLPPGGTEDVGFVDPGTALVPPEVFTRAADDTRSKTFLHDELRASARGGIDYVLQIQLRPEVANEIELALDCTRPWPEERLAWRDLARLQLDEVVDDALIEPLAFNPGNAPHDLALPLARSAGESSSLAHVRSIVYEIAAHVRRSRPLPPALAGLMTPSAETSRSALPKRRICIVGAGVSGLTAARELERLGHEVTVLEKTGSVAGKCASIEVDGRWYDLGGHVCNIECTALSAIVDAHGMAREAVSATREIDLATQQVLPVAFDAATHDQLRRYQVVVKPKLAAASMPGMSRAPESLMRPIATWLGDEGIAALGATVGVSYTASGYGYLSDPDLSAAHFHKYMNLAVARVTPGSTTYWTVAGGFGNLWERVAADLDDLRCDVTVESVQRTERAVTVRTSRGTFEFDDLVLACPLDSALGFLDASDGERELISKIRYVDYYTTVCRATGLPPEGFYFFRENCVDSGAAGRPVSYHHRYDDSDVYLFYSYGREGFGPEDIARLVREDAERAGGRIDEVITQRRWNYLPHFSVADAQAGSYQRLDALQGTRRTYFLGSVFDFELIEYNVRFARDVVRRFFGEPSQLLPARDAMTPGHGAHDASGKSGGNGSDSPEAIRAAFVTYVQDLIADEFHLGAATPSAETQFRALGLDSVRSVQVLDRAARETGLRLAPVVLIEHGTIGALASYLTERYVAEQRTVIDVPHLAGAHRTPAENAEFERISRAFEASTDPAARAAVFASYLQRVLSDELGSVAALGDIGNLDLITLGLDSVRTVAIIDRIVRDTGLTIAPLAFFEFETGAALAGFLATEFVRQHRDLGAQDAAIATGTPTPFDPLAHDANTPEPTDLDAGRQPMEPEGRWFQVSKADGTPRRRLFCLHDAGGTATMYRNWAKRLPRDVEVRAIQLPRAGADGDRSGFDNFESLLAALEDALAPHIDLPYAILGHSMGALIAFELTQRLRRSGLRGPGHLFVSGFEAPHTLATRAGNLATRLTENFIDNLTPAMRADIEVLKHWRPHPEPVLDIPITAFLGNHDVVISRTGVEDWSKETSAAFRVHVFPGGHGYLFAEVARVVAVVRVLLQEVGPAASDAAIVEATADMTLVDHDMLDPIDDEPTVARVHAIVTLLDQRPSAMRGSWTLYDLAWAARTAAKDDPSKPLFPEALAAVRSAQAVNGALGSVPCPHPHFNFVRAITLANTLIRWDGDGQSRDAIERAIAYALIERERSMLPLFLGAEHPYGRYYQLPAFFGHSLLPSLECRTLLERGERYLTSQQRKTLASIVRNEDLHASEDLFDTDSGMLQLAEFFPSELIASRAARSHVQRAAQMPGSSAAFTARYLDVNDDAPAAEVLRHALQRPFDGLRPGGRLQEVHFTLYYLMRGGIDVRRHCPGQIAYVASTLRPFGVGIHDYDLATDCDGTAVALAVCHTLGIPTEIVEGGSAVLDGLWSERLQSYRSAAGYVYTVGTLLSVLEAYLTDARATYEKKRTIWRRTISLLANRVWFSIEHMSPFHAWERVISVLSAYADEFAADPTTAHHEALDVMLAQQEPSGGFKSHFFTSANVEETALALLAMKSALAGRLTPDRRSVIHRAAVQAQRWLEQSESVGDHGADGSPDLWVGKLAFTPVRMVEAIIAASLARPLASIASSVTAAPGATPWMNDLELPEVIRPQPRAAASHAGAVLLTGATGFLGAFLAAELLSTSTDRVLCLARAADATAAVARVEASMREYRVWDDRFRDRLVGIAGDLSQPHWGLGRGEFDAIASTVDAIYHNGAMVSFATPYRALQPSNVGGTVQALRLAAQGGLPLHFVSTLGVFPSGTGRRFAERDHNPDPSVLGLGYQQSKCVAEALVFAARARGLTVSVHRPGLVCGATRTGASNRDDLMCRLLKGIAQLGCMPADLLELQLSLVPVDYVARAIVQLSRSVAAGSTRATTFHQFQRNETRATALLGALRNAGHSIAIVDYDTWLDRLRGSSSGAVGNALLPLLPMLVSGRDALATLSQREQANFQCDETLDALGPGWRWPDVDEALFDRFYDYLEPKARSVAR